jgi:aminoglycoside phosphotransferase family enzyme/predicted kinase
VSLLKDDLHGPGIEVLETHASWVFLAADTVWKIKKPVDFGFLDFTTLEKRHAACEAEVRLNARLAPHVYQGVVPVTRDAAGRHRIGGDGEVVDWAVKMVRLPDAQRADLMLRVGLLGAGEVEELAEHIARFHARTPTSEEIARFGRPEALLANVRENFAQTRDTIRSILGDREATEIEAKQIGFLEEHRDLLDARLRAGRIRDGHGDLRLEHVYLPPGSAPTIIDCIEFNQRFRYADVCADIAFLSMDLERLGRVDLAERLLAAYARASDDYDLYPLVNFYRGYRAYVRGKVASMLSADGGADFLTRERARKDARRSYLLALVEGREALLKPVVVAVGGIIASGKSTIAERVATMMGAPIVDADRTRKAMLGVQPTTRIDDAVWSGAYAPDFTERVYTELLRRAGCVLSSGRPVVLDATFRSRAEREAARALGRDRGVPFYFVECRVDREECRRRLHHRGGEPSVSDGRLEIFDAFVARWEPVDELPAAEHLVVDTSRPIESNAERLRDELPTWPPGLTD